MTRYISDGTWFDKGTECELVEDCSSKDVKMGIFRGMRTCENSAAEAGKPVGTKYLDEELCGYDEFEVIPDRQFLGKPLRDISIMCNPDKITLDEFIKSVSDALPVFARNMENLAKSMPSSVANGTHFPERIMETFLAWYELEQDPES